jgi:hypothetical protein
MQGFERRLEKLVEGTFGKAFRSGLEPVEVGRKVTRALDAERTVGVDGVHIAPNNIGVYLAHDDFDRFSAFADALARELAEVAREHARAENYHFVGPVTVTLVADDELRAGSGRSRSRSGACPTARWSSPTLGRHAGTPRSNRSATVSSSPTWAA